MVTQGEASPTPAADATPMVAGGAVAGRPGSGGRPVLTAILWLALVVAGVFAAWQGHIWWVRGGSTVFGPVFDPEAQTRRGLADVRRGPRTTPAGETRSPAAGQARAPSRPATRPAGGALSPLATTQQGFDPLAAAGLEAIKGEPADLAPPAGTTRGLAFQTKGPRELQVQAGYQWRGRLDEAADHYRQELARAGFTLVDQTPDASGSLRLLASRGEQRAIVILRKADPAGNIVDIVVLAISPMTRPDNGAD